MGRLRTAHLVEAGIWLVVVVLLFASTFKFNQPIEIYKFGASAWPRALLALVVIAVFGQLYWQYRYGNSPAQLDREDPDEPEEANGTSTGLKWYAHTATLIALPFVFLRLPDLFYFTLDLKPDDAHWVKLLVGALVIIGFIWLARNNHTGGMLALPMLFAAMLEDFGFYALAPFFILAVMYLMGEKRIRPMLGIMAILFGILVVLFVSILYVGLPIGNIEPFYSFGSWVVTVMQ